MTYSKTLIGFGQDSHKFLTESSNKICVIGGLQFKEVPGMQADSDGDVVFHAICNALTSITHVPILGEIAIDLCHNHGVTDSRIYLERALETLTSHKIVHIALSIEGKKPRLQSRLEEMREHIANLLHLTKKQVGITCTSGDGLTSFGKGEGLQCFCIVTVA